MQEMETDALEWVLEMAAGWCWVAGLLVLCVVVWAHPLEGKTGRVFVSGEGLGLVEMLMLLSVLSGLAVTAGFFLALRERRLRR